MRTLTNQKKLAMTTVHTTKKNQLDDIPLQANNLERGGAGIAETATRPKRPARPVRPMRPEVAPRRSTRDQHKPDWYTSGEYMMGAAVSNRDPEWVAKANYLRSFLDNPDTTMQQKLIDALINVITQQ